LIYRWAMAINEVTAAGVELKLDDELDSSIACEPSTLFDLLLVSFSFFSSLSLSLSNDTVDVVDVTRCLVTRGGGVAAGDALRFPCVDDDAEDDDADETATLDDAIDDDDASRSHEPV
jgi:hypothetical protein